jgi:hypothetical protein
MGGCLLPPRRTFRSFLNDDAADRQTHLRAKEDVSGVQINFLLLL